MFSLPKPRRSYKEFNDEIEIKKNNPSEKVPGYGSRKNYNPSKEDDFGDGGAFPELHFAQFPKGMGNPDNAQGKVVALTKRKDENGNLVVNSGALFDANRDSIVYSSLQDMKENQNNLLSLAEPSEEEKRRDLKRTEEALGLIVSKKVDAAKPGHIDASATVTGQSQFIKYTGNLSKTNVMMNKSGRAVKERVIRMVEQAVDPLEPPKFRHQKLPSAALSDPVPVLHEQPKKLTIEEQRAWKIPPCVSNWKNAKGYTIPLDKRLAADGRNLVETTINDKFASFAEALMIAEGEARHEIAEKNKMRQELAMQERKMEEEKLRKLAAEVRQEKSQIFNKSNDVSRKASVSKARSPSPQVSSSGSESDSSDDEVHARRRNGRRISLSPKRRSRKSSSSIDNRRRKSSASKRKSHARKSRRRRSVSSSRPRRSRRSSKRRRVDSMGSRRRRRSSSSSYERQEQRRREQIRIERRKDRQRDYRLEKAGQKAKAKFKNDGDRDISELIALGKKVPRQAANVEAQFDARLFNQEKGVASGFGAEEDDKVYDKPLFNSVSDRIYRPKKTEESEYGSRKEQLENLKKNKFENENDGVKYKIKPARDFSGVSRDGPRDARSGPVEFEREK